MIALHIPCNCTVPGPTTRYPESLQHACELICALWPIDVWRPGWHLHHVLPEVGVLPKWAPDSDGRVILHLTVDGKVQVVWYVGTWSDLAFALEEIAMNIDVDDRPHIEMDSPGPVIE